MPAAPGVLTATVLSLDADFDPAVSIRDVCALSDTERACNEDDAEAPEPRRAARTSVSLDGRAAQVVVIVDGHDGEAAGAYRLTLEWRAM
ncbi:MAG: hypothetical protein KC620_13575 [Myxococcales bacterium]|nr:hypothetical protein [Myxococcales bacterium]